MISIPISIAIALSVFNSKENLPQSITPIEELPKEITLNTQEVDTELSIELPEPIAPLPELKPTKQKLLQPELKAEVPQSSIQPTKNDNNTIPKINNSTTAKEEPSVKVDSPIKNEIKKSRSGVSVPRHAPQKNIDPLPELKNTTLRKLKRTLYKNLKQDGLVSSKSETVEIALPGNEIFINGYYIFYAKKK